MRLQNCGLQYRSCREQKRRVQFSNLQVNCPFEILFGEKGKSQQARKEDRGTHKCHG